LGGLWALEWAWQSFRDIRNHTYDFLSYVWRFVGVKVGVANFFSGQSIGIDENNTFQTVYGR